MTSEEWTAIESEMWPVWEKEAQRRLDRIRVRGYAEVIRRRVEVARKALLRAEDLLAITARAADSARKDLESELDDEEIMLRVMARGDADEFERIARALEGMGV